MVGATIANMHNERREVVEGGRKGVFGLGARPVRIRVDVSEGVVAIRPPSPAVPDTTQK